MNEPILIDEPIGLNTIPSETNFISTDIFGKNNNIYNYYQKGDIDSHANYNPSNDSQYLPLKGPTKIQQFQFLTKQDGLNFDNYFTTEQNSMTGQNSNINYFLDTSKFLLLNDIIAPESLDIAKSKPIGSQTITYQKYSSPANNAKFDERREFRREYNRNSARKSRQRKKELEKNLREKIEFYELQIPQKKQELEVIMKKIEELKVECHFYSHRDKY
ncbi:10107_t:CDS:2 [Ambispora gerdemannii]|uniref:10107_t:CDS:1 n=1 Tax=Ambispora gerdemannii TaxID=144530 RepID=A0A9N9BC60_9GLOM|nr:10107_t:CDS:2 [Ambispora gerdemannii]